MEQTLKNISVIKMAAANEPGWVGGCQVGEVKFQCQVRWWMDENEDNSINKKCGWWIGGLIPPDTFVTLIMFAPVCPCGKKTDPASFLCLPPSLPPPLPPVREQSLSCFFPLPPSPPHL